MQLIKTINEVLAFILELIMFFSMGYFGYSKGGTVTLKWVFAVLLVVLAITLWGIFAAPNSQTRLNSPIRLIFELSMFLIGAFFVYKTNHAGLAISFAILSVVSVAVAYVFKQ
jgi:hypothetical protein